MTSPTPPTADPKPTERDWDEYRVMLFKRKIRAILPELQGLRFERSIGRCNLIIPFRFHYYEHADEVLELIMRRLKENGIEGEAKAMFDWHSKPDYVTIPIDQEALPERARAIRARGES